MGDIIDFATRQHIGRPPNVPAQPETFIGFVDDLLAELARPRRRALREYRQHPSLDSLERVIELDDLRGYILDQRTNYLSRRRLERIPWRQRRSRQVSQRPSIEPEAWAS